MLLGIAGDERPSFELQRQRHVYLLGIREGQIENGAYDRLLLSRINSDRFTSTLKPSADC